MTPTIINEPLYHNPLVSHAIRVGDLVFTSGQCSFDPQTGEIVHGDITVQAHRVIQNLALVLEAAGAGLSNAVRASVFLRNWEDFDAFNQVYHQYFPKDPPCRVTTQAGRLGFDFLVEIDLIAVVPGGSGR